MESDGRRVSKEIEAKLTANEDPAKFLLVQIVEKNNHGNPETCLGQRRTKPINQSRNQATSTTNWPTLPTKTPRPEAERGEAEK
jgi:hypothetical protein